MKKIYLFAFSIMATINLFAQNLQPVCGSDQIIKQTLAENPEYSNKFDKTKEYLKQLKIKNYKTVVNGGNTEYHIPVVVHVIHTGGAVGSNYNPSTVNIQSFIDHINDGYANTNDDPNVAGTFNSVTTPLRFYLAQRDELNSCSATTGINRIDNSANATYVANGVGTGGITDASLKSLIHWNDLDYYNIYIVNKIDGEDGYTTVGSYTAGYAYYPVLGGFVQDGMVVLAQQVSQTNSVFIHELGHAFNLIHPFEGGDAANCPPNANCATDNDEVCDTDPIKLLFTCNPSGTNSCTGLNWNVSTIQYNYMAYNGCSDRFTNGQSVRINDVIDNVRTAYKNTSGVDAPTTLPVSITAPTYNPANIGNNANMGPMYVNLNTIEYTSDSYSFEGAGDMYYVDHTCNQSTTLIKGNTYPVTVKTETNAQKVRIYIDYDNNGTFGTSSPELVFSNNGGAGSVTHSGNVTVPNSGIVYDVPLRMRVIADNATTITPTMQLNFGQAEDYTIYVTQAALPVIWKNFSAQLNESNNVLLKWSTEMEKNNDFFVVEHSIDGISFNSIYKTDGQHDKYTTSNYSFLHKNAAKGLNYYRIKQVDIDGKFSTTQIEKILINEPSFTAMIYPNPINDVAKVLYNLPKEGNVEISILDINGKLMYHSNTTSSAGQHEIQIPCSNFANGMYFIKITSAQTALIEKLMK